MRILHLLSLLLLLLPPDEYSTPPFPRSAAYVNHAHGSGRPNLRWSGCDTGVCGGGGTARTNRELVSGWPAASLEGEQAAAQ